MFNCFKCKKKRESRNEVNILLDQLVKLNIKYNTEFNKITNELNKIRMLLEYKIPYELDSVRKNTPISIYIQPNLLQKSITTIPSDRSTVHYV